jgi:hypothetical protein
MNTPNDKVTIEDFKEWLVLLGITREFMSTVKSNDIGGGSRILYVVLHMNNAVYRRTNEYRINVVYREHDDGWVCINCDGIPLDSGPLTDETFHKIARHIDDAGYKKRHLMRVEQIHDDS